MKYVITRASFNDGDKPCEEAYIDNSVTLFKPVNDVYCIDIIDLLAFINKYGRIVLCPRDEYYKIPQITIYDYWIE